jgi:hypothetical protein
VAVTSQPVATASYDLTPDDVVHASHRYVLPVLSGICFVFGAVLLLRGPGALGAYAPIALLILGASALASSLAYLHWRYAPVPPGKTLVPAVRSVPDGCIRCARTGTLKAEWEDLFFGRFEALTRGEGSRASPQRVLFTPTSAADQLWVHWLPTAMGELPTELIGPIPETAYFPNNPDLSRTSTTSCEELPPEVETLGPGVTVILDPPLPPMERPGMPDSSRVGPVSPISTTDASERPSPSSDASFRADHIEHRAPAARVTPRWLDSVLAEANNPMPPHLRATPARASGPGPAGLSAPVTALDRLPTGPSGP